MKPVDLKKQFQQYLSKGASLLCLLSFCIGVSPQPLSLFSFPALAEISEEDSKRIAFFKRAVERARELGDTELELVALMNLGEAYGEIESYGLAIEAYQPAMFIILNQGNNLNEQDRQRGIKISLELARAYYFLGNCQSANALSQLSWELSQNVEKGLLQIDILLTQGSAAYCLGRIEAAIDAYQTGLDLANELEIRSATGKFLGNLGLSYIHLGEFSKAIEYLEEDIRIAQQLGNDLTEGQALGNLGDAYYYQQDYNNALKKYELSLAIAKREKYERGIGLMLANIGQTQIELEQFAAAERSFREGITVLEGRRIQVSPQPKDQISIFERQKRHYDGLQEAFIAQNKIEAALEISERSRARVFVESLANRLSTQAQRKVTTSPPTIETIRSIAQQQQATLVSYSLIAEDTIKGSQTKSIYIWVIQPSGEIAFRQVPWPTGVDLNQWVNQTRTAIGVRGAFVSVRPREGGTTPQNRLKKLHQLLIEPIAQLLPQDPTSPIIFVPQGELFLIPFAALQAPDDSYLIDHHTILTAPAIQVLQLTHEKRQQLGDQPFNSFQPQDWLIVGNPVMPELPPDEDGKINLLRALPGAEEEAKAVAGLFGANALLGAEAKKAIVVEKMQQARMIHLATHGLFNDRLVDFEGVASQIALTPDGNGKSGDGFLTGAEILDLDLQAELAVLSACDTGRGKITGDGVVGLSRSLILAGIPTVVVSLWSVPDAPTADLMVAFYENLRQNPNKAQALRQAMLEVKENRPAPRDWAAFTLVGEGG